MAEIMAEKKSQDLVQSTVLSINLLYEDSQEPERAYVTDSGLDVFAHLKPRDRPITSKDDDSTVDIRPGEHRLIGTGISVDIPMGGTELYADSYQNVRSASFTFELQVRSKSGNALKRGLFVLNSPGTVDNGYKGEIGVILANFSNENKIICHGDPIAQLVLNKIYLPAIEVLPKYGDSEPQMEEMKSKFVRSTKGYGSTGLAAS